MTRLIVCDVCEFPIEPHEAAVEFAGGDYHDAPECMGAMQAAWAEARAKVRKPATPPPPPPLPTPPPTPPQ